MKSLTGLMRNLFNPWVILGAVLSAILLVLLGLYILEISAPVTPQAGLPTAVVVQIPAPSATPIVIATPSFTPTPTPLPPPPSPLPGVLTVGALVQITGTGGDGLNLRDSPGLNGKVQYLGFESEVFEISEGPQDADGLNWWLIVGFYDRQRSGWAAANFLEVIQEP